MLHSFVSFMNPFIVLIILKGFSFSLKCEVITITKYIFVLLLSHFVELPNYLLVMLCSKQIVIHDFFLSFKEMMGFEFVRCVKHGGSDLAKKKNACIF